MGLTSATRVNEILRGRGWPADDDQARALLDALGAVGSEVDQGMRLFGAAQRNRPAQVRSSTDSVWWRHSGYIDQLRDMAPHDLLDRRAECDELAEWCRGDERYVWWQAPPSAGKSALMAWFVLHPPPGMWVVSFFVTSRLSGQDDSSAYTTELIEQLAAITGEEIPAAPLDRARDRAALLRRATEMAVAAGRRLVLVLDGLDEDCGTRLGSRMPSIASCLPKRPPDGLRVIVAGRSDPPIPADVDDEHPLRRCRVRHLEPSPYARRVAELAQCELDDVLGGEPERHGGLGRDVIGLVAASGGGLDRQDLEELTGRATYEVDGLLRSVFGRTVAGRADPSSNRSILLFTHETLRAEALSRLGPVALDRYQQKIHAWADSYRLRGWPAETPHYLLRRYFRMLRAAGDLPRMTALATDFVRHDRMLDITYGDHEALTEIKMVQDVIVGQPRPDLAVLGRVAVHHASLAGRNAHVPTGLPSVWVKLGSLQRAASLARSITDPDRQAWALSQIAETLVEAGDTADAESTAAEIALPQVRAWTLCRIATMTPNRAAELVQQARSTIKTDMSAPAPAWLQSGMVKALISARDLPSARFTADSINDEGVRRAAITRIAVAAFSASDVHGCEAHLDAIESGWKRTWARATVAASAAATGDADLADALIAGIEDERSREWATARVAIALVGANQEQGAVSLAQTITDPITAAWAYAGIARAIGGQRAADLADRACSLVLDAHIHPGRVGVVIEIADQLAAVDVDRASAVATSVEKTGYLHMHSDFESENIVRLAEVYAATGQLPRAERMIRTDADPVRTPRWRSSNHRSEFEHRLELQIEAFARIARRAASAGNHDGAVSVASAAPRANVRVLAAVADELAPDSPVLATEIALRAERTARTIENIQHRDGARERLALTLARVDPGIAQTVAEAIPDPAQRQQALANLARNLAFTGSADIAERVARAFPEGPRRVVDLASIASLLADRADPASVSNFIRFVEGLASSVTDLRERSEVLADLARALARDQPDRALEMARAAGRFAGAGRDAVLDVATVIARVDASRAMEIVRELPGKRVGFEARWISVAMVRGGFLNEAELFAKGLADDVVRNSTITELAVLLIELGHLDRAEGLAASLDETPEQVIVALVKKCAAQGDLVTAQAHAERIHGPSYITTALKALIEAAASTGDEKLCRHLIRQTETVLHDHAPASDRVSELAALAHIAAFDQALAVGLVKTAETTANHISMPAAQAFAIRSIARIHLKLGDPASAEKAIDMIAAPDLQAQALAGIAAEAPTNLCRGMLARALALGHWEMSINELEREDSAALLAVAEEAIRMVAAGQALHGSKDIDRWFSIPERDSWRPGPVSYVRLRP
ncbi:hypothetical protein RB614_31415 [Phytohabitans sp. ZYX-F-186]|uniref:Nephrocystin 3-like N-terminal domain-containing protein n=1 Tax=Phytohabitans maris TaxID=3071409 RepID=A0ABU0ZPU7_9ACTN|nr:hypothetical protein [Phytohabitans sp. ZYX-F-186]MDQ7909042.1 hypothetical protein [Phytohabitans sp. ZYX-F-186]